MRRSSFLALALLVLTPAARPVLTHRQIRRLGRPGSRSG